MMDTFKGVTKDGKSNVYHIGRQNLAEGDGALRSGKRSEGDGGESKRNGWGLAAGESRTRKSVSDGEQQQHHYNRGVGDGREEKWSEDRPKEQQNAKDNGPRWRDYVDRRDIKSWLWRRFSDDKSQKDAIDESSGEAVSTSSGCPAEKKASSRDKENSKEMITSSADFALKPVWYPPPPPSTKLSFKSAAVKSSTGVTGKDRVNSGKKSRTSEVIQPVLLPRTQRLSHSKSVPNSDQQTSKALHQDIIRATRSSSIDTSQIEEKRRNEECQRMQLHQQQKLQLYHTLLKRCSQAQDGEQQQPLHIPQHLQQWQQLNQARKVGLDEKAQSQLQKISLKEKMKQRSDNGQSGIKLQQPRPTPIPKVQQMHQQIHHAQTYRSQPRQVLVENSQPFPRNQGQEMQFTYQDGTGHPSHLKPPPSQHQIRNLTCTRPCWLKENVSAEQQEQPLVTKKPSVSRHQMIPLSSNCHTGVAQASVSSQRHHPIKECDSQFYPYKPDKKVQSQIASNDGSKSCENLCTERQTVFSEPSSKATYIAKMMSTSSMVPWLQRLQSHSSNLSATDKETNSEVDPNLKTRRGGGYSAEELGMKKPNVLLYPQQRSHAPESCQPLSTRHSLLITEDIKAKDRVQEAIPAIMSKSLTIELEKSSSLNSANTNNHQVISASHNYPVAVSESSVEKPLQRPSHNPFNPFVSNTNVSVPSHASKFPEHMNSSLAPPKPPRVYQTNFGNHMQNRSDAKHNPVLLSKSVYLNPPVTHIPSSEAHEVHYSCPPVAQVSNTSSFAIKKGYQHTKLYPKLHNLNVGCHKANIGSFPLNVDRQLIDRNKNPFIIGQMKTDTLKTVKVRSSKRALKPPTPKTCHLRSKIPPPKPKRSRRFSLNSKVLSHPVNQVRSCSPGPFIRQNILNGLVQENNFSHISRKKEVVGTRPPSREMTKGSNRRGILRRNSMRSTNKKPILPKKGIMKVYNKKPNNLVYEINQSPNIYQPLNSVSLQANKNENLAKPPIKDKGLQMFEERNRRLSMEEASEDENVKEEKICKVPLEKFRRKVVQEGREKFMALEAKNENISSEEFPKKTEEKDCYQRYQTPRHVRFGEVTKIYEFTEAARRRLEAAGVATKKPVKTNKFIVPKHRRYGSDPVINIPDPDPAPICTPSDLARDSLFSGYPKFDKCDAKNDSYVSMKDMANAKVPGVFLDDDFQMVLWEKMRLKRMKENLRSSSSCEDFSTTYDGNRHAHQLPLHTCSSNNLQSYRQSPKPWIAPPSYHAPLQRSASDNISNLCYEKYPKQDNSSAFLMRSKASSDWNVQTPVCEKNDQTSEMFADNPMYGHIYPDHTNKTATYKNSSLTKRNFNCIQSTAGSCSRYQKKDLGKLTAVANCPCSECSASTRKENRIHRLDSACNSSGIHKPISSFDGPCNATHPVVFEDKVYSENSVSSSDIEDNPHQHFSYEIKPLHRSPRFDKGHFQSSSVNDVSVQFNSDSEPPYPKPPPRFYISESESETEGTSYPIQETHVNFMSEINGQDVQDEPEWRVSILQALKSLEEGGKKRTAVSTSVTMTKVGSSCTVENWEAHRHPDVARRPVLIRSLSGPDVLESCRTATNIPVPCPPMPRPAIRHTLSQSCVSSKNHDYPEQKRWPHKLFSSSSVLSSKGRSAQKTGSSKDSSAVPSTCGNALKIRHLRTSSLGEDATAKVQGFQHVRASSLVHDSPALYENWRKRSNPAFNRIGNEAPLATSSPKTPHRSTDRYQNRIFMEIFFSICYYR